MLGEHEQYQVPDKHLKLITRLIPTVISIIALIGQMEKQTPKELIIVPWISK